MTHLEAWRSRYKVCLYHEFRPDTTFLNRLASQNRSIFCHTRSFCCPSSCLRSTLLKGSKMYRDHFFYCWACNLYTYLLFHSCELRIILWEFFLILLRKILPLLAILLEWWVCWLPTVEFLAFWRCSRKPNQKDNLWFIESPTSILGRVALMFLSWLV